MTDAMFRVLVVEDDTEIRTVLRTLLESAGFRVELAGTVERGLVEARANRPDAVLVDLGLPDGDGHRLIREIRSFANVPVIVISARHAEKEKVLALDEGADDFVTKPFSAGELLARLRAALRRSVRSADHSAATTIGLLSVDLARREARDAQGGSVHLTPLEFRLLECLLRNLGSVVTQDRIIREVWGPALDDTRRLRSYIKLLRQKLEADPAHPRHLLTEIGVGYRLVAGE